MKQILVEYCLALLLCIGLYFLVTIPDLFLFIIYSIIMLCQGMLIGVLTWILIFTISVGISIIYWACAKIIE